MSADPLREAAMAEAAAERGRHAGLGYTDAADDALGMNDWVALLARHVGLAASDGAAADRDRWRRQMARTAAVALAALEADARARRAWRDLIPLAAKVAAETGERALVVPHAKSLHESRGSIPYVVSLSQSTADERAHAVWTEHPPAAPPAEQPPNVST